MLSRTCNSLVITRGVRTYIYFLKVRQDLYLSSQYVNQGAVTTITASTIIISSTNVYVVNNALSVERSRSVGYNLRHQL